MIVQSNRVLNHHNAIFASEKIYKIKLYLSDMLNTLIIKIYQYKYKFIIEMLKLKYPFNQTIALLLAIYYFQYKKESHIK